METKIILVIITHLHTLQTNHIVVTPEVEKNLLLLKLRMFIY